MLENAIRSEAVEKDLDRLIERRSREVDPDENTELWRESVRKYNARDREQRLWEWAAYHRSQLEAHTATFERLIRRHKSGLRLVEEALGIEDKGDDAA